MRVLNNPSRRRRALLFSDGHAGDGGRKEAAPNSSKPVPKEQWHALIREAHPGYIEWVDVRRQSEEAGGKLPRSPDPSERCRRGKAPRCWQGLAICGNWRSAEWLIRYHWRGAELVPDLSVPIPNGGKARKSLHVGTGANVDNAVSALLMEAVTPVALEVSLAGASSCSTPGGG